MAWTVYAGKDVNWDLLAYHYYAPFELLAGRLGQDFFAASAQSYLNPVGYLPFYLMVSSGWHSVVVSVALAAAHSLTLSMLFLVAWRIFAHLPSSERTVFACLGAALGAATWVFWPMVGTSYLDPLLTPLMLAALLLLLDAANRPVLRSSLAGALFGAVAALKYTNAVFALAALPLSLAMPGASASGRLRACAGYLGGAGLAFVVLAGPWLALLVREFGNPVFPLFNAWFQSPHGPAYNIGGVRFTPQDWTAALSFPFRMATLEHWVYTENFAPDLRFAALIALGVALPAFAARRGAARFAGADWRLFAFVALSFVLWLASSANGRYGLLVLLLAGVCLARMIERAISAPAARIAITVLIAVQISTSLMTAPKRWYVVEPWSKRWIDYDAPVRAIREPALYLSIEPLPVAVVAPFVHPESSFVNFRGQYSVPTESPKLARLLEQHRGRVRALGRSLLLTDGRPADRAIKGHDATLIRIGYRIDPTDCFNIPWRSEVGDPLSREANRWSRRPSENYLSVVSCALRPAIRDPAEIEKERRFSALFDRIEKACPTLFRGQSAVTEALGGGWSRNYSSLDVRLESDSDRLLLNRYGRGEYLYLGRIADWERGEPRVDACGRSR
jgi:hypothetical protein